MEHKFNYQWTLADAKFTKDKGKVFSCFACGGGSTMGYKLAGFDVIGCNEIDPRTNKVYVENHHPKFNFLCDIRELVGKAKTHELPEELYNLDVLDGSPPCSSFSTAGKREKGWGKEKHFREGQTSQVLDTLFFDFIELAKELQPKVVVAENVKGLTLGEATKYVKMIGEEFRIAGYSPTLNLCNGAKMGIPQNRERVFFVAIRNDLLDFVPKEGLFEEPFIDLYFNEPEICCGEFADYSGKEITGEKTRQLWENRKYGDCNQSLANERLFGTRNCNFGQSYAYEDNPSPTMTAKANYLMWYSVPKWMSEKEIRCIASFPQDYNFLTQNPNYICGMSVPPVMMAQVASRVYEQWLSKIK
jgi:DNA (cytosine-5)-methyltransferase 1